MLKDKLKKAVLRFVVEKYKREIGNKQLSKEERDKFKANMYVYLNELMIQTVQKAIEASKDTLHVDIYAQQNVIRDERQNRATKSFQDANLEEKCMRLYREGEITNDFEQQEKWLLNCYNHQGSYYFGYYGQFASLCLKNDMYLRAEYYLYPSSYCMYYNKPLMSIISAASLVQRDQFEEAKKKLEE